MALQQMFPGVNNSIPTMLSAAITASATTLPVDSVQTLPDAPNLVTIGGEDNAEVVRYDGIDGNRLTGCMRGFSGTAPQIWPAQTPVYRAYTAHDHGTFLGNLEDLDARKLDADGSADALIVAFEPTAARENIQPGETLSKAFGKLARWLSALGEAAWATFGEGHNQAARGDHAHAQYAPLNPAGKVVPAALSSRTVSVTAARTLSEGDAGCCLQAQSGGLLTLTIPPDASAAFAPDTELEICQAGTGTVRLACGPGVVLQSLRGGATTQGVMLAGLYAVCALKKVGENTWRVTGELA